VSHSSASNFLTKVTLVRILLVPVIMALIIVPTVIGHAYAIATALFAVAAATDFVDGYLARRWAATTMLGSFLDTTADKLLVAGTLIALVAVDRASPWIALIIIGRELLIMALRGLVATAGTFVKPSIWGKWKATVQFVAITLSISSPPVHLGPLKIDEWLMIVAGLITMMSGIEYVVRYARLFSNERASTQSPREG
jgi:CDP-diacylglycerol--glycerol-3-phosphate 3-phosphatidyltransferase